MKAYMTALGLLLLGISAAAQDLPRQAAIGLQLGPREGTATGAVVLRVFPGTAAEAAGILPGDVIERLEDAQISSGPQFAGLIGRHRAGDRVAIALLRNGQRRTVTAVLKARPFETSPVAEVLYKSVQVGEGRRRMIVTRPKAPGKYPAVLLIGGLGCYSLDGHPPDSGYGRILAMFAEKGFVTVRVEKTGEGDSDGPACTSPEADLDLEVKGLVAGLRAVKSYDFVDPQGVFVFAHSVGPIVGVKVVRQEPVRGFIAAETIGRAWLPYELENVRRQGILRGMPYDEIETRARRHQGCIHRFFVGKEAPEAIIKDQPGCAESFAPYGRVSYTFLRQVGDVNLPAEWKNVDIPVLVIYGTSDPATSADEGRYLTNAINSFHPDRAEFVEIEGMDHGFNRARLLRDGLDQTAGREFHTGVLEVVSKWLERQMDGTAGTGAR